MLEQFEALLEEDHRDLAVAYMTAHLTIGGLAYRLASLELGEGAAEDDIKGLALELATQQGKDAAALFFSSIDLSEYAEPVEDESQKPVDSTPAEG